MRILTCQDCNTNFEFHAVRSWAKRCPACRKAASNKRAYDHAVRSGKVKKPGVGSGGAQRRQDNHQWKGGVAAYRYMLKQEGIPEICFNCSKDLSALTSYHKLVHHLNEDRSDNRMSNLKWCCKACHQNILHVREREADGTYGQTKIAELSGETLATGQSEPKASDS
jgi:hypothetical protein